VESSAPAELDRGIPCLGKRQAFMHLGMKALPLRLGDFAEGMPSSGACNQFR
jgi:hypothetical protein